MNLFNSLTGSILGKMTHNSNIIDSSTLKSDIIKAIEKAENLEAENLKLQSLADDVPEFDKVINISQYDESDLADPSYELTSL